MFSFNLAASKPFTSLAVAGLRPHLRVDEGLPEGSQGARHHWLGGQVVSCVQQCPLGCVKVTHQRMPFGALQGAIFGGEDV